MQNNKWHKVLASKLPPGHHVIDFNWKHKTILVGTFIGSGYTDPKVIHLEDILPPSSRERVENTLNFDRSHFGMNNQSLVMDLHKQIGTSDDPEMYKHWIAYERVKRYLSSD